MIDIAHKSNWTQIIEMARALQNTKTLARANENPIAFFKTIGVHLPAGHEYQIHVNNYHELYFVIPTDPSLELSSEFLTGVVAVGAKVSSLSTTSSASTITTYSCPSATLSTLSLASSITTASTVDNMDKYKYKYPK